MGDLRLKIANNGAMNKASEYRMNCYFAIIIFLFVFNFELIKGISLSSSTYLAIMVSIGFLLFSNTARLRCTQVIGSNYFSWTTILFTILLLYSVIASTLHGALDYSFPFAILKSYVIVVFAIVIYCEFRSHSRLSFTDMLAIVFLIQSIIIVLSFFVPAFKSATDCFRSESAIEISGRYEGYRGLAIAGSSFFGLSICYAYVLFLLAYKWDDWSIRSFLFKLGIIIILIFAGVTAGRTAVIGLAIGLFAKVIDRCLKKNSQRNTKNMKIGTIVTIALAGAIVCAAVIVIDCMGMRLIPPQLEAFYNYAVSFIVNFNPEDVMSSISSTETLANMYFPLSLQQLVIGDGMYTYGPYTYYMGTDAGYMRTILFFGIPGLLLMCLCEIVTLVIPKRKEEFLLFIFTIILLLVLEYKGEAILIPLSLTAVLVMSGIDLRFHQSGKIAEND